jgi:ATP-dependent Clp protease ATP-binding subunit ClpA
MYELFTDTCKQVIRKANEEATLSHSQFISSGHVLVALTDAGADPMAELLRSFGAEPRETRSAVGRLLKTEKRDLPKSPHFKQVVGYMLETARRLDHDHVGTEHLLLGLLHDRDGIAVRALEVVGVDIDGLQAELSQRMPPASPEMIAHRALEERFKGHPDVLRLKQHIMQLQQSLYQAVRAKEFEKAAAFRDERVAKMARLKSLYCELDQGSQQ